MVSVRSSHLSEQRIDTAQWIAELNFSQPLAREQFTELYHYVEQCAEDEMMLRKGREMVAILASLNMDVDTLMAAMLVPLVQDEQIVLADIKERFGNDTVNLVDNVVKLEAIGALLGRNDFKADATQVDNLRRMLLAMVEDVRAVVIKLAERVAHLREVKNEEEDARVLAARETAAIYGPLANRLGIGQLKWEMEDYAFRYQHPDTYKRIAKLLDEKRIDREQFIESFVARLSASLEKEGIKADVYGRPKHIYSIWKKMQRKHLEFDQLFDVRAVRVVVDRLQDCYAALGVVHTSWRHIPREFDDYVATPKPNGYQSIHTVVVGPEGKNVEIQIRTRDMHEDAELGVAAHWKYKEGALPGRGSGYEEKIAWLRKILQWQEEVAESGNLVEEIRNQVFEDRVYVFTPKGEVVDLPAGATPLDFAYYVHSQVGHRCIGAKVGGRIVPFTYQLQNGDQVEVLTGKVANPSRDWLNPNLGYLISSRARSKVQHWFKTLDRDKNLVAGKDMLESELQRVGIAWNTVDKAVSRFNMNNQDDLLVAIGAGDVRLNQVVNYLQSLESKPLSDEEIAEQITQRKKSLSTPSGKRNNDAVVVDGVGNLMTSFARCCQPVHGDQIGGYITQGRGISVHRLDCDQYHDLLEAHPERGIDVRWGECYAGGFSLTVRVVAADRSGLLRDITTLLANEKINVLGVKSHSDTKQQTAVIDMNMEIYNIDTLSRVLGKLNQLDDILEAKRL